MLHRNHAVHLSVNDQGRRPHCGNLLAGRLEEPQGLRGRPKLRVPKNKLLKVPCQKAHPAPHTQARAGEGGAYGVAGAISRIQGRVEEQHGTDSDAVLGVLAPIAEHPGQEKSSDVSPSGGARNGDLGEVSSQSGRLVLEPLEGRLTVLQLHGPLCAWQATILAAHNEEARRRQSLENGGLR